MVIRNEKAQLRKEMLAKRLALSSEEIKEKSIKLTENFLLMDNLMAHQTIMAFMPFNNEVDTTYIINYLLEQHKCVALPRVDKVNNIIKAFAVRNLAQDVSPGTWGIMEPKESLQQIMPKEVDMILVPGVAFSRMGCRLGYGGGFYDRFLAKTKGIKLGLCFDFQVMEHIPIEAWDIALDRIITDEGCY